MISHPRFTRVLSFAVATVFALLASSASMPTTWANDQIPPLTSSLVERYTQVVAWLTGVDFDARQRAELRAQVEAYWRNGESEKIGNVVRSMEMWSQLNEANPAVREATLAVTRPDVLVSLQTDALQGAADSRWIYEQFLRANPPLAPGKPGSVPLTRDIVDAALDYEYFLNGEVMRRGATAPTLSARENAYKAAAASYATLSAEEQMKLAAQPGKLALERMQWNAMSPQVRAILRAQLGATLTPEDQMHVREFQSMGSQQWSMVQGQLNAMQQNSEMIMGRGTTWNSTLGRWEQHGGIVTEYDTGVVRVP